MSTSLNNESKSIIIDNKKNNNKLFNLSVKSEPVSNNSNSPSKQKPNSTQHSLKNSQIQNNKNNSKLEINNNLNENKKIISPPKLKENNSKSNNMELIKNDQKNEITNNPVPNSDSPGSKRKKDWRSWSSEEKILFYEIIANGGNYSSLQKLFKTMNDKIGTKSTEKIRDYYYRMLKNVNALLKSTGEIRLNNKNRDEVILAISCYGKLLTSYSKKNKFDMKKLNKHPRMFKRTANTLKKLITNKIKLIRAKMIPGVSGQNQLNNQHPNQIQGTGQSLNQNTLNQQNFSDGTAQNQSLTNTKNKALIPSTLDSSEFSKIINVTSFRKIPYETFILRITPFDQETYLKMIEANLSSRLEINVSNNKPIKYVIEVLCDKWKSVIKKNPKVSLYLIPIEEIWIPQELTIFSDDDKGKAYDIGDIYTAYGSPNTNVLYMKYRWSSILILNYENNKDKIENDGLNIENLNINSNSINGENNNMRIDNLQGCSNTMLAQCGDINNSSNPNEVNCVGICTEKNGDDAQYSNMATKNENSYCEEAVDNAEGDNYDEAENKKNDVSEVSDDQDGLSENDGDNYSSHSSINNDGKSSFQLDTDLNMFDPLEFLAIDDDKKYDSENDINNNDLLGMDYAENESVKINKSKITNNQSFLSKKLNNITDKMKSKINVSNANNASLSDNKSSMSSHLNYLIKSRKNKLNYSLNTNNNYNNVFNLSCEADSVSNNNNNNHTQRLRTGYNEAFSQKSELNLNMNTNSIHKIERTNSNVISNSNLEQISSHIATKITPKKSERKQSIHDNSNIPNFKISKKKKIPFINNVNVTETQNLKEQQKKRSEEISKNTKNVSLIDNIEKNECGGFNELSSNNNRRNSISSLGEIKMDDNDNDKTNINPIDVSPMTNKLYSPLKNNYNYNNSYLYNNNKNSLFFFQQQSNNFGISNMCPFNNQSNLSMTLNNNCGGCGNKETNYGNNELSNFIFGNCNFSNNYNSIFEPHGGNTNLELFRNNMSANNIFKNEVPENVNLNLNLNNMMNSNLNNLNNINSNSNVFNIQYNKENPNCNNNTIIANERENSASNTNTKRKRKAKTNLKKKECKKITIEDLDEYEKLEKNKKNNHHGSSYNNNSNKEMSSNKKRNQTNYKKENNGNNNLSLDNGNVYANNIVNPYIMGQNNFFTNYPGQYYPQYQINPMNIDIPLPSKFLEDKSNDIISSGNN